MKSITALWVAITAISTLIALPLLAQQSTLDESVQSLRGSEIDSYSDPVEMKKWQPDQMPIERNYFQQPPLIPHDIEGYVINRKANKCLTCHSWTNYRRYGATKISQTHFEDRDNKVRANVVGARYFCTQCHVPQAEAKPLVENLFEPVESLR